MYQLMSSMPPDDGFMNWLTQGRRNQEAMSIEQLRIAATVYHEQLKVSCIFIM